MPLPQDMAVQERRIGAELSKLSRNARLYGAKLRAESRQWLGATPDCGYEDLLWLSSDLGLMAKQAKMADARSELFIGEDFLKIHFRLDGESSIAFPGTEATPLRGPLCGVMLHPQGLEKYEWVPGGAETWVTFFCRPGLLADTLGLGSSQLPPEFKRFLSGTSPDLYNRSLSLTPEMALSVNSLMNTCFDGALRAAFTEAKALELLCQVMATLGQDPKSLPQTVKLMTRDLLRLDEARDLLDTQFINPPSLAVLSRTIGINQTKLVAGFRHQFGVTVHDYCLRKRMEMAIELLRQSDQSITEIAYAVGYDYSSNFTAAFKRYFGYAPRLHRKMAP